MSATEVLNDAAAVAGTAVGTAAKVSVLGLIQSALQAVAALPKLFDDVNATFNRVADAIDKKNIADFEDKLSSVVSTLQADPSKLTSEDRMNLAKQLQDLTHNSI